MFYCVSLDTDKRKVIVLGRSLFSPEDLNKVFEDNIGKCNYLAIVSGDIDIFGFHVDYVHRKCKKIGQSNIGGYYDFNKK